MVTFALFLFGMLILARVIEHIDAWVAGKISTQHILFNIFCAAILFAFDIAALFQV
jgi:hypothetical protein